MILAAIALALQAPAYLSDPAFIPAYAAWIGCTHRVMDGTDAAGRRDEEIVAAAYAGCIAEEGAVRAAIVARTGAARGAREMDRFRDADREALLGHARAPGRGRAARGRLIRITLGSGRVQLARRKAGQGLEGPLSSLFNKIAAARIAMRTAAGRR